MFHPGGQGRDRGGLRAVRLGQVHPDQDGQRPGTHPERRHPDRRRLRHRVARPAQAAHQGRHGVPAFRAVPAPGPHAQPDPRPGDRAGPRQRHRAGQGRRAAGTRGLISPRPQASRPTVRRPAAACSHRPGAVHGPDGHAVRRTDVGAGP
ncbi:hypothetical protein G6F65_022097 [Rhizopus arrhizus]|nr:hypothetical protein G6F65_022097 [Rhizopus arrhizus]